LTSDISRLKARKSKLKAGAAFRLIEGLALIKRIITEMRDVSSRERLITKERRPLMVPRKSSSGAGVVSKVGRGESSGKWNPKGSLGISMSE